MNEIDRRKHYTPEQHRRANRKYEIANVQQMNFKFNKKTDADILEHLRKVPNMLGYIKELIRADIKENPL